MGFGRRLVRRTVRKAVRRTARRTVRQVTPRPVRKAVHPVRTARVAATPRPARQVTRAAWVAKHPVHAVESEAISAVLRRHRWRKFLGFLLLRPGGEGMPREQPAKDRPIAARQPRILRNSALPPSGLLSLPNKLGTSEPMPPVPLGFCDPESASAGDVLVQAADLVVSTQSGSASMIQRELQVSHVAAGLLLEMLEILGVVGPSQGTAMRDVLVRPDDLAGLLASLQARVRKGSGQPGGRLSVTVEPTRAEQATSQLQERVVTQRAPAGSCAAQNVTTVRRERHAGDLEYEVRREVGLGAHLPLGPPQSCSNDNA